MKKLLLSTTAAAVMLLAGCSRDEVLDLPEQEQSTPVSFATYVGNAAQTKGTCLDIEKLKTDHFGVYAFYVPYTPWSELSEEQRTTPNFMNNVEVFWNKDIDDPEEDNNNAILNQGGNQISQPKITYKWGYQDTKYWPVEKNEQGDYYRGNVTFFAYAPYNEAMTWDGPQGKLAFSLESDVKSLVDLVYSDDYASIRDTDMAEEMTEYTRAGDDAAGSAISERMVVKYNSDYVHFSFAHALSRISFSAEVDAPDRDVVITEIKVGKSDNGFYQSGNFMLAATKPVLDHVVENQTSGDGNVRAQVSHPNYWDVEGSQNTATFSLTAEAGNFIADNTLSSEPKMINNTESYLFVIPQDFSAAKEGVYLPISIKYTVTEKTPETDDPIVETHTLSGRIKHNFQQGRAYKINIDLNGRDGLNAVLFAVVDDFTWDLATDNPVVDMEFWPNQSILQ